MKPFIIENCDNTSYIDTLLFGLFYSISDTEKMLRRDIDNPFIIYLQEYILNNFVDFIRNHKSILSSDIEYIRFLSFYNGWLHDRLTIDNYSENYHVKDFYSFIMDTFKCDKLYINENYKSQALFKKADNEENYTVDYIDFKLNADTSSLVDLFSQWLFYKHENGNETDLDYELEIRSRKITNKPPIIAFSINRWNDNGCKNNQEIDIPKKIKHDPDILFANNYIFQFMICFNGDNINNGSYYCVLLAMDIYIIFDDKKVPCLSRIINPSDNLIKKFKKECVFIVYRLQN